MESYVDLIKLFGKEAAKQVNPIYSVIANIIDELENKEHKEKIEASFNHLALLVFQGSERNLKEIQGLKVLIDEQTKLISRSISPSGHKLERLNKLQTSLQIKLGTHFSNRLLNQKISYQESEYLIEIVDENLFLKMLEFLPDSFIAPVFASNLIDLMVEADAHKNIASELRSDVVKTLKKCDTIIKKQDSITKVLNYESLGAFGLQFDVVEYFDKYLDEYKNLDSKFDRATFQKISWWSDSHYNYDCRIMEQEHFKILQNESYNQLRYYVAQMLSSYEFEYVSEALELFNLDDNNEIVKKLKSVKFS